MKLKEAIDSYTNYIEVMNSKGSLDYLKGKTSIILQYLGNMDVRDINRNTLLQFIKDQRERNPDVSNRTINKYVEIIKRVLRSECDIVIKFNKLKQSKKIIPVVPEDVITKIFSHYEKNLSNKHAYRNYIMYRLLLETGLRINELLHLKVNDISFSNNSIHVKVTKIDEERYTFFTNKTSYLMINYVKKFNLKGYVFTDFKGNTISYRAIVKLSMRLKNRLDIDVSISPHKWRHTFATYYMANGGDIASLQKILGHHNMSTTEMYLHMNYDELRKRYGKVMENSIK